MTISPDIHAGVDTDMAKVKEHVRRMIEQATSSGPVTMKELRSDSARRVKQMLSGFRNQGTPSHKIAHSTGRHRRVVAHRVLHATKGYYGGRKSSRRSNRTAGARK